MSREWSKFSNFDKKTRRRVAAERGIMKDLTITSPMPEHLKKILVKRWECEEV